MRQYWLLLLIIITTTTNALVEQNLYDVAISVPSREISLEQKKTLVQQEFPKLLQKITGSANSLPIEQAEQYVTQFTFINPTEQNPTSNMILKFSFDKAMIHQELTTKNQPFLGETRPLTIIWLQPTLTAQQELLAQIINHAKTYSLPIVTPMFDLKELEILQEDIINEQLIKQASTRYAADEIILVNFTKKNDPVELTWKSITNNWQLNTPYIDPKTTANFFIEKLMEHFVKYYSTNNTNKLLPKEVITIKITNIINLEDYVKIENYLQNLAITKTLQTTKIQSGEVEFEVIAKGGKQAIRTAIAANSVLQENHKNNSLDPNALFYTLML